MKFGASIFIYPDRNAERLEKKLERFKGKAVEISFHKLEDFKATPHDKVRRIIKDYDINIISAHLPNIDVFNEEFINVIAQIKQNYEVKIFTLNPRNESYYFALEALKNKAQAIRNLGIVLCYENFEKKRRRWINTPEQIFNLNFDFISMTYDISHTRDVDIIEEFNKYREKIKVVHLSNKYYNRLNKNQGPKKHLPIAMGDLPIEKFLENLKEKNYSGLVILEYLEQFSDELVNDLDRLSSQNDKFHAS